MIPLAQDGSLDTETDSDCLGGSRIQARDMGAIEHIISEAILEFHCKWWMSEPTFTAATVSNSETRTVTSWKQKRLVDIE